MSVASRAHAVTESLAVPPLTEERLRDIEISRRSPAGHSDPPRGCDRGVRRRSRAHGAGRGHDPDARAQLWAPPTRARARAVERQRGWDPARRLFADDRSDDARGRAGGRARAPRDGRHRSVADREIRAQATLGGNLCATPGGEIPRGDLQAPLIALGARVTTAGAGGQRTEPVEDFLSNGSGGRLVLEVELEEPAGAGHATVGRPHSHGFTILAACAAETSEGVRVAVTGAGSHAVRVHSVEQALAGGASPEDAAENVLKDVQPRDDALASAWYRQRMLPVLVGRALHNLSQKEGT